MENMGSFSNILTAVTPAMTPALVAATVVPIMAVGSLEPAEAMMLIIVAGIS